MIGMTIAVLATVFGPNVTSAGYAWIIGAMVVGAAIGLYAARTGQWPTDSITTEPVSQVIV